MQDLKGITCVVHTSNPFLSPVANWGKELSSNRPNQVRWEAGAGKPHISTCLPPSHGLPKLGPPQPLESLWVSAQDGHVPAWARPDH